MADIEVIDFQKRGLPHAHILIILANQDRTARLSRKSVTNSVSWLMTKSGSECSRNQPIRRCVLVTILLFCQPSNPKALFEEYWSTWVDDFEQQGRRKDITLDEGQLKTMLLLDLELRLQSFEKQLKDFGLPVPSEEELARVQSITRIEAAVIRDELDYDVEILAASVEETIPKFTKEQQQMYGWSMALSFLSGMSCLAPTGWL